MLRHILSSLIALVVCGVMVGCTKSGEDGDGGSGSALSQFQGDCSLKVANGAQCTPKKGPIALLTLARGNQAIGICTGTFLTSSTVLTAGHCFESSGADSAIVSADGEVSESASYQVHPRYSGGSSFFAAPSPYDAAIVILKDSLNVATLPLLVGETPDSGITVNVIGYGLDEDHESAGTQDPSDSLNKGVMTYQGELDNLLKLEPGKGGQTACPGDSGGPAIVLNHDDLPGVLGIASLIGGESIFGLSQCEGVEFALYTNVQFAAVQDWIFSVVPGAGAI